MGYAISDWPPAGLRVADHNSLSPAIQSTLLSAYLVCSSSACLWGCAYPYIHSLNLEFQSLHSWRVAILKTNCSRIKPCHATKCCVYEKKHNWVSAPEQEYLFRLCSYEIHSWKPNVFKLFQQLVHMASYIMRTLFPEVLCRNAWKLKVSLRVVFYVCPKLTSE